MHERSVEKFSTSKCIRVSDIEVNTWEGQLMFPREEHITALSKF